MRRERLRVLALVPADSTPPRRLTGYSEKEIAQWRMEFDVVRAMRSRGHEVTCLEPGNDIARISAAIDAGDPHVVFNMLEEFYGFVEFEANVPALLELIQVPYTGCNPRGLAIAHDKALSKAILAHHGVRVPGFAVFPRGRRFRPPSLSYPLLVKSLTEEASATLARSSLVRDEARLRKRVAFVHEETASDAIVEEYIEGRELNVGLLGNARAQAFPAWELDLSGLPPGAPRFATARVKWDRAFQERYDIYSRPAFLPGEQSQRVRSLGLRVYRLLGLSGYARIDLRLRPDGEMFVLEANPNPDLSREDDFAYAAEEDGISYGDLIDRILRLGIAYHDAWYE